MPFIEIIGFDQQIDDRRRLARDMTTAIAHAFGISEDIVTVYFHPIAPIHYAHAGHLAPPGPGRVFIKVHAFPRPEDLKAKAARDVCQSMVDIGCSPKDVIIYFFDRERFDVAHAGVLQSTNP